MDFLVRKYQGKNYATLGCFERMFFGGYLPIQSGWARLSASCGKTTGGFSAAPAACHTTSMPPRR
jgi:hypothetical protein